MIPPPLCAKRQRRGGLQGGDLQEEEEKKPSERRIARWCRMKDTDDRYEILENDTPGAGRLLKETSVVG